MFQTGVSSVNINSGGKIDVKSESAALAELGETAEESVKQDDAE